MNRIAAVTLLALAPALSQADSVFLKGGGEIKGEIVERTADTVVLEVGPGRLALPMRNVSRIVSNVTDLGLFNTRAAALAPRDIAGWLDLARWAQDRDLATQARDVYERVLAADPNNATAHLALGDVRGGDRWLTAAEANRARGLIEFEGIWMTPEERQARMEERAALAQESQAVREADARAREAEARVREAEARARAAEADAQDAAQAANGIPYPYVFGPGYGPVISGPYRPFPGDGSGGRRHRAEAPPRARPDPPRPPRRDRSEPAPGPRAQPAPSAPLAPVHPGQNPSHP